MSRSNKMVLALYLEYAGFVVFSGDFVRTEIRQTIGFWPRLPKEGVVFSRISTRWYHSSKNSGTIRKLHQLVSHL